MCLKCDWNEPEGDLCKDFLWCGPRLQSESFPDAVIVWSSITSSLRHSRLGQERSEEEGCLTTLTMWRSHGCYLRCSPARNKSMDSACRARIRSGFAARDSCPNLLSTYFLLDIAYIAALFLLNILQMCFNIFPSNNKNQPTLRK